MEITDYISNDLVNYLLKFDKYAPCVRNICSYLPMDQLYVVRRQLHNSSTWTSFIHDEIKTRLSLSWQANASASKTREITRSKDLYWTEPLVSITFYNHNQSGAGDFSKTVSRAHINKHIPNVMFAVNDIKLIENGDDKDGLQTYAIMYLPTIPNIEIDFFCYEQKTITPRHILEANDKIECLLLFTTFPTPGYIYKFLNHLSYMHDLNIPIGGGRMWRIKHNQSLSRGRKTIGSIFGIMIKSNPTRNHKFYAASMIINDEEYEPKIEEFKNNVTRQTHELLMVFSCFDRDNYEEETKIISKHFKCPIITVTVNGEIGTNCYKTNDRVPNCGDEEVREAKRIKTSLDVYHIYSTSLVFMSWRK